MVNIKNIYKKAIGFRLIFVALVLVLGTLLYLVSPDVKFPLMVYKVTLVTIGACIGYILDMILFPNFRPKDLADEIESATDKVHITGLYHIAGSSVKRRAIVVSSAILAICLGL